MASTYAAPGDPACGDPHPISGRPCQLPPDHWADRAYHARPESGGFDVWHPMDTECDLEKGAA